MCICPNVKKYTPPFDGDSGLNNISLYLSNKQKNHASIVFNFKK